MSIPPPLSPRARRFREAIEQFIAERRNAKLKGLSAEKAEKLEAKYEYAAWITDAARRVSQIQAVTHVLKASHPDARGSSLYTDPESLPSRAEIGTHTLGQNYHEDIVGNAAALDVYKFLKIEVDEKRLLDWFLIDDPDLLVAISDDASISQEWGQAFKGLVRPKETLASHTLAKQVYWCVNGEPNQDQNFHLLQTLFPSSLLHKVHAELSDARFGDVNKAARQAYFAKKPHAGTFQSYLNLSVRKLGGTKPQNISQLNSERGGVNYLLSSSPPIWKNWRKKNYLGIDNAITRFRIFEDVNPLVHKLIALLKSNPDPTMETRKKREQLEHQLGHALANFGCEIRNENEPGWTRDTECHLPLHQKIWLDPDRAELPLRRDIEVEDREFQQALEWGDWPDKVASDFALWLNATLRKEKLPVGDTELKHWAKQALVEASFPVTFKRILTTESGKESSHD